MSATNQTNFCIRGSLSLTITVMRQSLNDLDGSEQTCVLVANTETGRDLGGNCNPTTVAQTAGLLWLFSRNDVIPPVRSGAALPFDRSLADRSPVCIADNSACGV